VTSLGPAFENAAAVYGLWLFQATKSIARCGDYRVLVAYAAGSDMLFLDRLLLHDNESTYVAVDGISIRELNYYEMQNSLSAVRCTLRGGSLLITGQLLDGMDNDAKPVQFSITYDPTTKRYSYRAPGSR
jgi:hypothetical protein